VKLIRPRRPQNQEKKTPPLPLLSETVRSFLCIGFAALSIILVFGTEVRLTPFEMKPLMCADLTRLPLFEYQATIHIIAAVLAGTGLSLYFTGSPWLDRLEAPLNLSGADTEGSPMKERDTRASVNEHMQRKENGRRSGSEAKRSPGKSVPEVSLASISPLFLAAGSKSSTSWYNVSSFRQDATKTKPQGDHVFILTPEAHRRRLRSPAPESGAACSVQPACKVCAVS